jgi:hypothetical protein
MKEYTGWLFDFYPQNTTGFLHPKQGIVLWLVGEDGKPRSFAHELSIAAPSVPVIAALICTTKRSVEGVRVLNLLGRQDLN